MRGRAEWRFLGWGVVTCLVGLALGSVASAQVTDRASIFVLGEHWDDEVSPFHGAIMLAWDFENLPAGSRLGVQFNTETFRLELDGLRLTDAIEFGARLSVELFGASLMFDYFQQGEMVPDRRFLAHYGLAQVWLRFEPWNRLFAHVELGARRWAFDARAGRAGVSGTHATLVLPPEAWVFEPRIYLAWWHLDHDAAWSDRHRVYPRLRGIAAGLNLGMNVLSDAYRWGALDPDVFVPVDPRNSPETIQYNVSQWLLAGWEPRSGMRLEWIEEAGVSVGEDDLSRRQIGGMNPYTVTIPGVPWAYFHAGDYLALQCSVHLTLVDDLEVGPLASAVWLRDVDRVGADEFDLVWGVGGLIDWRVGGYQLSVRGGYSPALGALHPGQGGWSVLWMLGWGSG